MTVASRPLHKPVSWSAALGAGIAAGILATLVQIALWSIFLAAPTSILLRDTRFTAAIVLGRRVLLPAASVDAQILMVATLVHFALSVVYSLIIARLIAGLNLTLSLLVGVVFGIAVYGMNMYGFTSVFPWFESSRDWITVAAHAAFGIAAAASYKMLSQRSIIAPGRPRGDDQV